MAKSKRDLVNSWRDQAADFDALHEAYKAREKHGETIKIPLSAHYSKLAEMAAAHAMALDTSTS